MSLHRRTIRSQSLQIASSTLISRLLGLVREYLMLQCIGAGAMADIFITAFKIPNSLRKIFAEGALSTAFVPVLITATHKQGMEVASALTTLAFLFFEFIVLLLCAIVIWKADWVIWLVAGGFNYDKQVLAVPFLQLLMPFIFFISSSALLAGPLQSKGHFFIPSFSAVILNVFFIAGLIICYFFKIPIIYLCFFILMGGAVQLLAHIIMYLKLHFSFLISVTPYVEGQLYKVLSKFLMCLIGVSVMEIGFFIDTSFASYLADGSISLLYYANRFMNIPLGVFAVTISTILLPHFSRVAHATPRRLSIYVFESTKLVLFVTLPLACMLIGVGEWIFYSIHLTTGRFTPAQIIEARNILYAFVVGLPFFSLNKVLLNVYYALHVTFLPTLLSVGVVLLNVILNYFLMQTWGAAGLALATSIALGMTTTLCLLFFLEPNLNIHWYPGRLLQFLGCTIVQLGVIGAITYGSYCVMKVLIVKGCSVWVSNFLLNHIGFWLWIGPLCALAFLGIWTTYRYFGIELYFLE